jgi:transposase
MDTQDGADAKGLLLEIIEQQAQTITVLREQVQGLQAEVEALRRVLEEASAPPGLEPGTAPAPAFVKPNRPQRDPTRPRKKRAQGYARKRMTPTKRVNHAVEVCDCGCVLRGGTLKRTREVLHIPLAPVEVIEHGFMERRCPQCGKRHVPKAGEVLQGVVVGKRRLSCSVMALIASLREVARMPLASIAWYLASVHQLVLGVGEIAEVLQAVAHKGQQTVEGWLQELRHSPVVHADETVWREEGRNGYFWVFNTPSVRYFEHRPRRSGEIVLERLGEGFEGTLVSDFYGGYSRMHGQHQRCWVHLWRDVHELREKWPAEEGLERWAQALQDLYERAKAYPGEHVGERPRERLRAKQALERELLGLAHPYLESEEPQRILCQRIERYLPELLTFVLDPRVPSHNNDAERAIRPFAVSRKISGGTRSGQGTRTKGLLATLFATWRLRGLNPLEACCQLLSSP